MPPDALRKGYARGTHRLVAPAATLERIQPHLAAMDITRLADITGLDRLGIPTFCAVRPTARLVQTANGKGLEPTDARVSALMEAIEVFHAENPRLAVTHASLADLRAAARPAVHPAELPQFQAGQYFHDGSVIDWVEAEELHSKTTVLIPASAAVPRSPSLYRWSTNGLASGNHLVEATLHALYEIIERHALTQLLPSHARGAAALLRPTVTYYRLATITSPPVAGLCERLARADIKLQLAAIQSPARVHTFWAILLDRRPLALSTQVNVGYGTHVSPTVAAVRAITEAAQSRLALIHASREDLATKPAFTDPDKLTQAYNYFNSVTGGGHWPFLVDGSHASLADDFATLLASLWAGGLRRIYRVNLTREDFGIPVVMVLVPGLLFDPAVI